jgi:hypothetical protein
MLFVKSFTTQTQTLVFFFGAIHSMGQHVIHDTQKNYKEISMGAEKKNYFFKYI